MALVQVTPYGDSWKILIDGGRHGGLYETQRRAEEVGRAKAKELKGEFQLHGENGYIRVKDSYGDDPRRITG